MAEKICNQVDVSQLECHFKWFKELNDEFNGQWRLALLNKQLHNDLKKHVKVDNLDDVIDDHLQDDETDKHNQPLSSHKLELLSWHCTLILRKTFEKNFAEAFQMTKELLSLEEAKNPSQPQVHVDTFSYVVLANQLNILDEWRSIADCPVDVNEVAEIVARMDSLKNSEQTNEGKAFINCMKSNLSKDMQDYNLRVEFAKKATELNPHCAWWHDCLYLALRCLRRSTNFSDRPSRLEIDSCEKAFELESGAGNVSIGNTVAMTKLYGELLFGCRRGGREHQELSEKAIKYARDAVRLRPHSIVLKIRLVSLLTSRQIYTRSQNEYYAEAQEIVKECEVGPYLSSEICHKLGKFYDKPNHVGHNSAKALEWYERALDAHIGNFPCFSEMLRNANFQRKSTVEVIEKIDSILRSQHKLIFKCQVMFIKGFFLWINDEEEASLDIWLSAMELATDFNKNIFVRLATSNFCYLKPRNADQVLRMMRNVKVFMSRRVPSNLDNPSFTELKNVFGAVIKHFER